MGTRPSPGAPRGDASVPKATAPRARRRGHVRAWHRATLGGHWAGTGGHRGPWEPWGPGDGDLASPILAWGPILPLAVPEPAGDTVVSPTPARAATRRPQAGDRDTGTVPSATSTPNCPLPGDGCTMRAGGARAGARGVPDAGVQGTGTAGGRVMWGLAGTAAGETEAGAEGAPAGVRDRDGGTLGWGTRDWGPGVGPGDQGWGLGTRDWGQGIGDLGTQDGVWEPRTGDQGLGTRD